MLSHPLLVEAAETLFVPACVYNNLGKGTADHAVLTRFSEPTWNNPVVRVLDVEAEGTARDLVPRIASDWTVAGVTHGMQRALGKAAPTWLQLLAQEERGNAAKTETAIFGMG